jgi:hypothetical protein
MAPTPTLQEVIDSVRHDSSTGDALDQLRTAAATVAELSAVGDEALGYFVDRARRSRHSWTDISAALGVTRQAAHKRFAAATRPPGLDQFTARALRVVAAAADVAHHLGHPYVGTEHLLLSLYAEEGGVARMVLTGAGISRDAAEQAVLHRVPRRNETPEPPLPHTARAAAVLEGTLREALQLGHNYVGTEHLLLAFYAEPVVAATSKPESGYRRGGGMAAEILTGLGLDRATARDRVVRVLASYTPDGGTGA